MLHLPSIYQYCIFTWLYQMYAFMPYHIYLFYLFQILVDGSFVIYLFILTFDLFCCFFKEYVRVPL